MMSRPILLVPLDDRPCNVAYPQWLARVAGLELKLPPSSMLGHFTQAGDPAALADWMEASRPASAGALLSLDMLCYGGLVASREPRIDLGRARANFEHLTILRPGAGDYPVYAFMSVMRAAPTSLTENQALQAQKVVQWARLASLLDQCEDRQMRKTMERLERQVPAGVMDTYIGARRRNFSLNLAAIDGVKAGWIDYLAIGLDDTSATGYSVRERDALLDRVEELAQAQRIHLGTGTDELALLLLARMALAGQGKTPTVCPVYSHRKGARVVTRYEDRSIAEVIASQVKMAGARLVRKPENADLLYYVHVPPVVQREAIWQGRLPKYQGREMRAFIRSLSTALESGRVATLADVYYANGGDDHLVTLLQEETPLVSLAGYAAWNTAGNTLGTALAHGLLRWLCLQSPLDPKREAAHYNFLLMRFMEDWGYQAIIRPRMVLALSSRAFFRLEQEHERAEKMVGEGMRILANKFFTRNFEHRNTQAGIIRGPLEIRVALPWERLFEVDVQTGFSFHCEPEPV